VISQGIELLIFGMGTVVVFLSLLVFAVRLMSAAVLRWFPETPAPPEAAPAISRGGAGPGPVTGSACRHRCCRAPLPRCAGGPSTRRGIVMANAAPLGITELVLPRRAPVAAGHAFALEDMLPMAAELDAVGFWSMESWGGATFDACIRYLGEDPWERIRELKRAMPNTPQQMLLRGQNILGYRHYADDVVDKFVERAALNGVDVFRVFDAMNDMRNIEVALRAVKAVGRHAQGTIAYTLSPVHDIDYWVDQGKRIEDMGADSIAIKDMAGLLRPYVGYELVTRLKAAATYRSTCSATPPRGCRRRPTSSVSRPVSTISIRRSRA
jgi:sodium pump decarboxylase gamma subunit